MDLVLLHALPLDASMWRWQNELLEGRTHAPTLYGFGDTLSNWADAVLSEISAERLIVVGNSVGGSVGLEMAAQAPNRVAALILVGAKAGHRADPGLQQEALDLLSNSGVEAAWSKYWAPLFSTYASSAPREEAKNIAAKLSVAKISCGVNAFHTRQPRNELLEELDCPVICVMGEHDVVPGLKTMRAQAKAARNGQLIVVPDCGHYVPLERPQAMNSIIRTVLKTVT